MNLLLTRIRNDQRGIFGGYKGADFQLRYRLQMSDEEATIIREDKLDNYRIEVAPLGGVDTSGHTLGSLLQGRPRARGSPRPAACRAKAHRHQLLAEYGRGEHEKADYKIMLAAADQAIEHTQAELAKLHARKVAGVIPPHGILQEVWDASSIDWRRNVTRLVIERIVVKPGSPGSHIWNGRRFNPDHIVIQWVEGARNEDITAALQMLVLGARRTQAIVAP